MCECGLVVGVVALCVLNGYGKWEKLGRSDYPRTPQDTPGHPRIPQDTPRYLRTHLISYIIHLFMHLFIHSGENRTKMVSNSFHFQVHSFEKVLLNTAEKP